jgi:hypothetical protein
MSDTRYRPVKFVDTKGVLFFCCFGVHFLVGFNGKLWRLNTLNRKGHIKAWASACMPNRVTVEILWIETNRYKYPLEFMGRCTIFERKHKHDFVIHDGCLENINHLLIKLQRWTRRMQQRARVLALCMALHPRLGAKSWLAGLGDIFPLIKRQTFI